MNTPWRQPTAPWPPPPPCARVLPLICFSRCLRTTNALNLCAPRGFSPWPPPPPCAPVLPLSLLFSVSPWLCGEHSFGCGYAALCSSVSIHGQIRCSPHIHRRHFIILHARNRELDHPRAAHERNVPLRAQQLHARHSPAFRQRHLHLLRADRVELPQPSAMHRRVGVI